MLPRGYPALLPPAGTGYSCFQSSFFPASWEKSVPMQQTGERWSFPGKASCFASQSGFSVVKGCCDGIAHAPLLLVFPTAPHTEIPWHWEQWPSSSTPRGFEGIHQEGGFMPLPLQSGLALTSVQGLPKHLQAGCRLETTTWEMHWFQSSTHVSISCLPLGSRAQTLQPLQRDGATQEEKLPCSCSQKDLDFIPR